MNHELSASTIHRNPSVIRCGVPGGGLLPRFWMTLYWPDRHSKFHRYERLDPTARVERLLVEIDADPTCIFWG